MVDDAFEFVCADFRDAKGEYLESFFAWFFGYFAVFDHGFEGFGHDVVLMYDWWIGESRV
jgi:hypothetical protein